MKTEFIDAEERQTSTEAKPERTVHVRKEHEISDEGELSEPGIHSDGEEWLPSDQEQLIDSDLEEQEIVKREDNRLKTGLLSM